MFRPWGIPNCVAFHPYFQLQNTKIISAMLLQILVFGVKTSIECKNPIPLLIHQLEELSIATMESSIHTVRHYILGQCSNVYISVYMYILHPFLSWSKGKNSHLHPKSKTPSETSECHCVSLYPRWLTAVTFWAAISVFLEAVDTENVWVADPSRRVVWVWKFNLN